MDKRKRLKGTLFDLLSEDMKNDESIQDIFIAAQEADLANPIEHRGYTVLVGTKSYAQLKEILKNTK